MSPIKMGKIEGVLRTTLAFKDALNAGDVDGMMALLSEDCLFESYDPAPDGVEYLGKEAIRVYWTAFIKAHPNLKQTGEDSFTAGYRCELRWKLAWDGENGERKSIRGVYIVDIKEGLITELRAFVKR